MKFDLKQKWPSPSNPKPVIIIGAGGIVRDAHLPAYKLAKIPVKGTLDLDMQRSKALAADFEISNVYSNITEAVADNGTNAVYDIAVPPSNIANIIQELPDGAATLIQKPMGSDQDQAREIRAICRTKGLKSAMNFQLRFSPMMLAVKDAIDRGWLGELLEIEVHLNIYTPSICKRRN